ncbi:MAG: hypothetical protein AB1726_02055 [Planctomycetota bacterium]
MKARRKRPAIGTAWAALGVLLAGGAPARPARHTDPAEALETAARAEANGEFSAALQTYEDLYDSTILAEETRARLRAKFPLLRRRVLPNADPERAGRWTVLAFAFGTLDFAWTSGDGAAHRARYRFRDDEIESLRGSMAAFAATVWRHSAGELVIDWDLVVIDEPLRALEGEDAFWPGPSVCLPFFGDLAPGSVDSIFVHVKVRTDGGEDETVEEIPLSLLAGTFGVLPETLGATYIGFNCGGGWCLEPSGEVQWHEWLHAAQWALEARQGYPPGLFASSDNGHMEGEPGGDPCYGRKESEPDWMGFYAHIMENHVTRRMWRELSVRQTPENVWCRSYCRDFLLLGPFPTTELANQGLDAPFLDEVTVRPRAGEDAAGRRWTPVRASDRLLDLTAHLGGEPERAAYVAALVHSEDARPATVRIGSDDGCRVWHEGQLVLDVPAVRGAEPDQDSAAVELAAGDNLFLLKVTNVGGGWAAAFRVTDPAGNPLRTITYGAFE